MILFVELLMRTAMIRFFLNVFSIVSFIILISGCDPFFTGGCSLDPCEDGYMNVRCEGLPQNAEWNTAETIKADCEDYMNGTVYGVYNEEPSTTECRYKCKKGYVYNSRNCIDKNIDLLGDWSRNFYEYKTWEEAVKYCEDLEEKGFSDWRLPSISELRVLIRNCPKTEKNGDCKVSDYCTEDVCFNKSCAGCEGEYSYSIFGDAGDFWSSSSNGAGLVMGVNFFKGAVWKVSGGNENFSSVKCIRTDVDKKRVEPCGQMPKNSIRTGSSKIVQVWDGLVWNPSGESFYSENTTENMCSFSCDLGYTLVKNRCLPENYLQKWSEVSKEPVFHGDAAKYCEDLVEEGYDNWWLPNISELVTLITAELHDGMGRSCTVKVIDGYYSGNECYSRNENFSGTYSILWDDISLWSKTLYSENVSKPWLVDFYSGAVLNKDPETENVFVRCVKRELGKEFRPDLKIKKTCVSLAPNAEWNNVTEIFVFWNGTEWVPSNKGSYSEYTVLNECTFHCKKYFHWTGLECIPLGMEGKFAKISDEKMSFTDAEKYCEELVENGYHDYRLPTISELRSLVKYCYSSGIIGECGVTDECLDETCFDEKCEGCADQDESGFSVMGDKGVLWSSSIVTESENEVWTLDFDDAGFKKLNKNEDSAFIRCAR